MNFEILCKMIQKYVGITPTIIVGSGASIPMGLPGMEKLASELKNKISLHEDSKEFKEWSSFLADIDKTNNLEESFTNVTMSKELGEQVIRATWEIINEQDIILYAQLLKNELDIPLIKTIKHYLLTTEAKVEIITTNYDRLIEYSATISDAYIFQGFTPGYFGRFIGDSKPKVEIFLKNIRTNKVNIVKVHGSLDWFYNEKNEPVFIPMAAKIPEGKIPCIVTPGNSKFEKTHDEPFRTNIGLADNIILDTKGVLCIGYGFNDKHFQEKLIKVLKDKRIPVVVLAKKLTEKAKELLISGDVPRYILIEENDENSSRIFASELNGSEFIINGRIWDLKEFNKIITD